VVTCEGKAHLALSTDAYSHKVMGYSWSRRADTEHVKQALLMSLEDYVPGPLALIHHSDNASVYASKAYQQLLKKQQILPSWSPPGRPDRNPIAERINQTFKQEYLCDSSKKSFEQISQELPVYIRHYNESRPHMSCGNGFPSQVHEQQIKPKQLWRQRPASYRRPTPEGVPPPE
jgi:transposase InsO family protein